MNKEPNKHLTYEERNYIEIGLNNKRNFTEIAKDLNKHRTTIMREVQGHRLTILKIYVRTDENVKNLIVQQKKNVTKKKDAQN